MEFMPHEYQQYCIDYITMVIGVITSILNLMRIWPLYLCSLSGAAAWKSRLTVSFVPPV